MADISLKRAHKMELSKAKDVTDRVVKDVKDAFPKLVDKIEWNKDKTQADLKGKGFSGKFSVDDTNIGIDVELSFLTRPFKGTVEEKIKQWMDKYIG